MGGAWQPPNEQRRQGRRNQSIESLQLGRSSQAVESSRESGVGQRPWQRRRLQAGPSDEQLQEGHREGGREAARADQGNRQGWRRLVPGFLRRNVSGAVGRSGAGQGEHAAAPPGLQAGLPVLGSISIPGMPGREAALSGNHALCKPFCC